MSKWPKWPWRSRSMTFIFNTSWEYTRMHVWCKFSDLNLNCDELSCGQAEFPRAVSKNDQNDFEGQGRWPPFWIPAESVPGCIFGENLVIPVQICDELSCGQAKVYGRTDGRTDGQTQATTIPLRPERPRGKNGFWVTMPAVTIVKHGGRSWLHSIRQCIMIIDGFEADGFYASTHCKSQYHWYHQVGLSHNQKAYVLKPWVSP